MNRLVMKWIIVTIILAAVIATVWLTQRDSHAQSTDVANVMIETEKNGRLDFNLEIAQSPVDIQVGLMFRESLPEKGGMIFLMGKTPRNVAFWMKNTLIPLDMLFVEKDGRIGHIHGMAEPGSLVSIPSQVPVTAVIEIEGGKAYDLGIRTGDKVIYSYFE